MSISGTTTLPTLVTPDVQYTATVRGSIADPTPGAGSILKAYWRWAAGALIVRWEFTQTSLTGATPGDGDYLFPLPAGFQANPALINVAPADFSQALGAAQTFSAADTQRLGVMQLNDATTLKMQCSTNGSGFMSSTFHAFDSAPGVRFGFIATIPVIGWAT